MKIEVHVYHHGDSETSSLLHQILSEVKSMEDKMDADLQAIVTQAQANTDAEAAADGLLASLFAKLTAAVAGSGPISAADRVTLQATLKQMTDSKAALAAAIVANTPAA